MKRGERGRREGGGRKGDGETRKQSMLVCLFVCGKYVKMTNDDLTMD